MADTKQASLFPALTGVFLVVSPAAQSFMSANLREPVTMLSVSLACWLFVRWLLKDRPYRDVLLSGVALLPALLVRPEQFVVVAFAIGAAMVVSLRRRRRGLVIVVAVLSGVATLFVTYVMAVFPLLGLRWVEAKRAANAAGSKGYLQGLVYHSWIDVVQFLPIRVGFLLSTPFPWLPSNYRFFFTTLDSIHVMLLLPLAGLGLLYALRHWPFDLVAFLAAVAGLSIAGYAVMVSSAGATARRRLFAVPVLALFAAYFVASIVRIELRYPQRRGTVPIKDWINKLASGDQQTALIPGGLHGRVRPLRTSITNSMASRATAKVAAGVSSASRTVDARVAASWGTLCATARVAWETSMLARGAMAISGGINARSSTVIGWLKRLSSFAHRVNFSDSLLAQAMSPSQPDTTTTSKGSGGRQSITVNLKESTTIGLVGAVVAPIDTRQSRVASAVGCFAALVRGRPGHAALLGVAFLGWGTAALSVLFETGSPATLVARAVVGVAATAALVRRR